MTSKIMVLAICGALSLAGCASTAPDGTTTTPASQVTDVINKAQQVATQICGFVPTINTITNILSLGNPTLTTATSIAQAVCSAVTQRSARRNAPRPNVQGVIVEGHFVR